MRTTLAAIGVALLVIGTAACGDAEGNEDAADTTTTTTAVVAPGPGPVVLVLCLDFSDTYALQGTEFPLLVETLQQLHTDAIDWFNSPGHPTVDIYVRAITATSNLPQNALSGPITIPIVEPEPPPPTAPPPDNPFDTRPQVAYEQQLRDHEAALRDWRQKRDLQLVQLTQQLDAMVGARVAPSTTTDVFGCTDAAAMTFASAPAESAKRLVYASDMQQTAPEQTINRRLDLVRVSVVNFTCEEVVSGDPGTPGAPAAQECGQREQEVTRRHADLGATVEPFVAPSTRYRVLEP